MESYRSESVWEGLAEHVPAMRKALLRGCRDEHEVEDLLQEALLRAARFRHQQSNPTQLRGWLRSIVRSVLNDHLRARLRRPMVEVSEEWLDKLAGSECEPGTRKIEEAVWLRGRWILREHVMQALDTALEGLADQDLRALTQRYGAFLICETGARCTRRVRNRKDMLFRARRRLERRLRARLPELVECSSKEEFVDGGLR